MLGSSCARTKDPEGDTASESEGEEYDLQGEKDNVVSNVVSSDGEAVGKPTMSRKGRTGSHVFSASPHSHSRCCPQEFSPLEKIIPWKQSSHGSKSAWWFVTMEFYDFPVHIWDVIRNPLTKSMIFQEGYCTTKQKWTIPQLDMLRKEKCWDPKYSKKSLKSPGVLLKGLLKVAILAKKSEKISKSKKNIKKQLKQKQSTHSKTNSKKLKNRKKTEHIPQKKNKEHNIFKKNETV